MGRGASSMALAQLAVALTEAARPGLPGQWASRVPSGAWSGRRGHGPETALPARGLRAGEQAGEQGCAGMRAGARGLTPSRYLPAASIMVR